MLLFCFNVRVQTPHSVFSLFLLLIPPVLAIQQGGCLFYALNWLFLFAIFTRSARLFSHYPRCAVNCPPFNIPSGKPMRRRAAQYAAHWLLSAKNALLCPHTPLLQNSFPYADTRCTRDSVPLNVIGALKNALKSLRVSVFNPASISHPLQCMGCLPQYDTGTVAFMRSQRMFSVCAISL